MESWANRWKTFAEYIAAALFAIMFVTFILQISSRYVFDAQLPWTMEICSIAYLWVIFWSCDILLNERQQIIFDILYQKFSPPSRRWLAFANTGILALIFMAALPGVIDYILFLGRRHTMVLHLRFDVVYACFGIFMVAAIVGAIIRLRRLLGTSWQTHL